MDITIYIATNKNDTFIMFKRTEGRISNGDEDYKSLKLRTIVLKVLSEEEKQGLKSQPTKMLEENDMKEIREEAEFNNLMLIEPEIMWVEIRL